MGCASNMPLLFHGGQSQAGRDVDYLPRQRQCHKLYRHLRRPFGALFVNSCIWWWRESSLEGDDKGGALIGCQISIIWLDRHMYIDWLRTTFKDLDESFTHVFFMQSADVGEIFHRRRKCRQKYPDETLKLPDIYVLIKRRYDGQNFLKHVSLYNTVAPVTSHIIGGEWYILSHLYWEVGI